MPQKPQKKKKDRYWTPQRVVVAALALLMAVLMLLPMFTMMVGGAQAASESQLRGQLNDLKSSATDMKNKKAELQQQLSSVKGQKDKALQEKQIRDQELAYIDQEISNTEQQIAYYEQLIAEEQVNLAAAQAKEEAQFQLFCERVRAMEEAGNTSYWSILFSASDFSDLLSRAVDIQDLMDYDNAVIDQLKTDRQAVADSLATLETTQAEQEEQKANLDVQRAEQAAKVTEAAQALKNAEADVAATQKLLDEQAAEEQKVSDNIAAKEKELAAKIEENRKAQEAAEKAAQAAGGGSGGQYTYPVPGYYTLTSRFGYRIHPITGRPNSHTGIDIAAAKNAPIQSVKGGVVTISEYGSSYGNYVVVAHGNGMSTLYAHMTSRAVSEGDTVSQGQVLGYVGSTGNSTGNHLHLELRINGERKSAETVLFPNIKFIHAASY